MSSLPAAQAALSPAPGPAQTTCGTCGATIFAKAEICPSCGVRQRTPVSKAALLLLTFFLGGIGAHKFYLGKYWQGALYLVFCWTYIPALVALVEFIVYAFTSSERLDQKYSAAQGSVVVVLVVGIVAFVFILGIVAAIALPAYNDYTKRAKAAEGIMLAGTLKARITEVFGQGPADMSCSAQDCRLGAVDLAPTKNVRRVSSDRRGVILIEFDEQAFPAQQNRLAIVPTIEGRPADLSDPANAGRNLVWQCGKDGSTTMLPRNLPAACR